ncbi:hypothetical protein [Streptomyces sp. NPDC059262]|uniref:hypothetical protein n=1 Tax=Streptomyces sp. NPDC059262 TaxID=3346797 RepID=UPI0036C21349
MRGVPRPFASRRDLAGAGPARAAGAWAGLPLFAVLALLPRGSPLRWVYGLVGLPDRRRRVERGAWESRVTSGRPA